MNLGEAPLREEGTKVYVFNHKDVLIPQDLDAKTVWTKGGQVDARYSRQNKPMLDWIRSHEA